MTSDEEAKQTHMADQAQAGSVSMSKVVGAFWKGLVELGMSHEHATEHSLRYLELMMKRAQQGKKE